MLWGLGPVQQQAAYGLTVDRLRRQIHSGLLLPAEKLPPERQLSDDFGISRVTLREALRVLETSDYITVRRGAHGGAFVTDEDRLVRLAVTRITRKPGDAMRVLEFLCSNECAAVELAVTRVGLPERKRMGQALDLMQCAATGPEVKQAETLFHLALGDAAHNMLFARAIEDALSELFLPFPSGAVVADRRRLHGQYAALLAALEAGAAGESLAAIRAIHDGYWQQVRRVLNRAA